MSPLPETKLLRRKAMIMREHDLSITQAGGGSAHQPGASGSGP
jgi:hypothetical protein